MLRKVKCDNIFVFAKSGDIANTESHITMALTESGASCINKSPLPPTDGGGVTKFQTHRERRHEVAAATAGRANPVTSAQESGSWANF